MDQGTEHEEFAAAALAAYDLPGGAKARLISLSENATFLVEADRPVGVLRIYRHAYQSVAAMRSELAWIAALRESGVVLTPGVVPTADGAALHSVQVGNASRASVMFEFVEGSQLRDDDMDTFRRVGATAAKLHNVVQDWPLPDGFDRFTWDLARILDPGARWGDWRDGPGHTVEGRAVLSGAEAKVRERLASYPPTDCTGGLVHGDLRAANILVDAEDQLWVIDFDDCGFSWFLWDLCSTTTFIEHLPHIDQIVAAWLEGYRSQRQLTARDIDVIPDLVFLRRLHILAWLGTHPESDLAHEVGASYTAATYGVAHRYLRGDFLAQAVSQQRL